MDKYSIDTNKAQELAEIPVRWSEEMLKIRKWAKMSMEMEITTRHKRPKWNDIAKYILARYQKRNVFQEMKLLEASKEKEEY